jgi:L-lysine exporter family protein LysE/ArgO
MISAFSIGFFLGFSLIMAIGAQNSFVLRQGILNQHVFYTALFCSISDALLILLGITGISFFLDNFIIENSKTLFGLSALWVFFYGVVRLKSSLKSKTEFKTQQSESKDLLKTISILVVLTFFNPHVYLDTVILIGSVAQQFSGNDKIAFGLGASFASFVFFFSLAYFANVFSAKANSPIFWKFLDFTIAIIMFSIAIKLAITGGWIN